VRVCFSDTTKGNRHEYIFNFLNNMYKRVHTVVSVISWCFCQLFCFVFKKTFLRVSKLFCKSQFCYDLKLDYIVELGAKSKHIENIIFKKCSPGLVKHDYNPSY
jgi:hypothetical protein